MKLIRRHVPRKDVPPLNFKRRVEAGIYWNISYNTRHNGADPMDIDQAIMAQLSRPIEQVSDWLRGHLIELRNLNKKRFTA